MSILNADPHYTIEQIQSLGNHPAPVRKLLDAYEELIRIGDHAPSVAGVTDPAKVAEVFNSYVEYLATSGDVHAEAKNALAHTLRRSLSAAVRDNQAHYIDQQREAFDQAAETYTSAVELLPEEFDADDVPNFSEEQFTAYRQARAAAQMLKSIRGYLNALPDLTGQMRLTPANLNFLILEPTDQGQANVIRFPDRPANPTVASIEPAFRAALAQGARFKLSTVAEANDIAREHGLA